MREYRLGEKEILQKKISSAVRHILFVLISSVILFFGCSEYGMTGNGLIGAMFFGGVLLMIFAYVRYLRQSEYWDSLRIFLESDRITNLVANRPMVTITKDTVKRIRFQRSGITVRSHKRGGRLFIPKQIKGFQEIQSVLRAWSNKAEPAVQRERRYRLGRWQIVIQPVE